MVQQDGFPVFVAFLEVFPHWSEVAILRESLPAGAVRCLRASPLHPKSRRRRHPKRLERLADGRIRYRLRHVFQDGTRAILFDPLAFIENLYALVPPPRANPVTYHGVLAPNAAWRARVPPCRFHQSALFTRAP